MNNQKDITFEDILNNKINVLNYKNDCLAVKTFLKKAESENNENMKLATIKLFDKHLSRDFFLDQDIIIEAFKVTRHIFIGNKINLNNFSNDITFIEKLFEVTNIELSDIQSWNYLNVNKNPKIMLSMLNRFGFDSLNYHSNSLYKDDNFAFKIIEKADSENWIDMNHDFIKQRFFIALFENDKIKKAVKFNLKDALKYKGSDCELVMQNILGWYITSQMKSDIKENQSIKKARIKKF